MYMLKITFPAGMISTFAPADQRDTPKDLISGGRISATRQVTGPIQPSEHKIERARLARNMAYLHRTTGCEHRRMYSRTFTSSMHCQGPGHHQVDAKLS